MRDEEKPREQIVRELAEARRRVSDLESRESSLLQFQKVLQADQEQYRALFDNSLNGFALHEIVTNADGEPVDYVFLQVNPAFEQLTGLSADQVIGRRVTEVLPGIENDRFIEIYGRVALTGESVHFEQLATPLGRYYDISAFSPQRNQFAVVFTDITEHKRVEDALRQSEATIRALLEAIPDLIFRIGGDGAILDFVPAKGIRTLLPVDQFLGRSLLEVLPEALARQSKIHVERALQSGETQGFEYALEVDGESRHYEARIVASAAQTDEVVAIVRDVTVRKMAEAGLQESEQRFREMLETVRLVAVTLDTQGRITFCNDFLLTLTGWRREEVVGKDWFGYFIPFEMRDEIRSIFLRTIQTGSVPVHYESVLQTRGGERRLILWNNTILRDPQGNIVGTASLGEDITDRRRAMEQLRKLSRVVEQSPSTVMITDTQGRIEYVNPKFVQVTGYAAEEVIGQNPRILKSGETPREEYARLWQTITGGREWRGEFHNKKKNGELYWEAASISPVRDEAGTITHLVAVKEDITERKQRESELEALVSVATALRSAFARGEVLQVLLDQVSVLLRAEGAAVTLLVPATREFIVEQSCGVWQHLIGSRMPPSEDTGDVHVVMSAPLKAETEDIGALWVGRASSFADHEARLLAAIADMAATAIHRAALYEQSEHHAAGLERRVAERTHELAEVNARLLELDRLKTKFVSDMSHELRTPVANLKLYVELLKRGKPEKRDRYIATLDDQADRLARLVENTLSLSRLELGASTAQFVSVDLNPFVESIVFSHRPLAESAGLALHLELEADLPRVRGEPNQLAQVITNLIVNAIRYTPAGEVRVGTRYGDSQVRLIVRDTGTGIAPDDLEHVFDRFYRGQGVAQSDIPGSGLGLAIVKEIVDLHRGQIEVESQVGRGSTFTVSLPAEESQA